MRLHTADAATVEREEFTFHHWHTVVAPYRMDGCGSTGDGDAEALGKRGLTIGNGDIDAIDTTGIGLYGTYLHRGALHTCRIDPVG